MRILRGASSTTPENTLFQEAADQGQTILAASGEPGAADCCLGTARAVDDPASQPYVTGVGGTKVGTSPETVWNDSYGAGGGGVSTLWTQPSYQSSAAVAQTAATCGSSRPRLP